MVYVMKAIRIIAAAKLVCYHECVERIIVMARADSYVNKRIGRNNKLDILLL